MSENIIPLQGRPSTPAKSKRFCHRELKNQIFNYGGGSYGEPDWNDPEISAARYNKYKCRVRTACVGGIGLNLLPGQIVELPGNVAYALWCDEQIDFIRPEGEDELDKLESEADRKGFSLTKKIKPRIEIPAEKKKTSWMGSTLEPASA